MQFRRFVIRFSYSILEVGSVFIDIEKLADRLILVGSPNCLGENLCHGFNPDLR